MIVLCEGILKLYLCALERINIFTLSESHSHFVLRSPVRHCELNPMELIWANAKGSLLAITQLSR